MPSISSLKHQPIRIGRNAVFEPLLQSLVAILLLALAAAIFVSVNKVYALNRAVFTFVGIVLLYLVYLRAASRQKIIRYAILLVLLGVGAAVLSLAATDWRAGILVKSSGLADHFPTLLRPPGSGVPNFADGTNPRLVGGTMAFLLPLPLALGFFGRGFRLRLVGLLSAAVISFPLILSQSPQALLGVALALGLMLAWRWPKSVLLLLPLLLAALGAWIMRDSWLSQALVDRLELGLSARLRIWPVAWLMIGDMPFTGVGLNNFPVIYDLYSLLPAAQPHAHNFLLQTAADLGIPGLITVIVLFFAAYRAAWRALRASENANFRAAMLGCAGAFTAFLGFGLFDAISLGHKPAPVLWAMMGLAFAGERLAAPQGQPFFSTAQRRMLLLGTGIVVLLTPPLWASSLMLNMARIPWHRAQVEGSIQQPAILDKVQGLSGRSLALYAQNSRAHLLLGRAALQSGNESLARSHLEESIAGDPADFQAHFYLAEVLYGAGEVDRAVKHWSAAGAGELLYRRGNSASRAGEWKLAEQWFRLALRVAPDHALALRQLNQALARQ